MKLITSIESESQIKLGDIIIFSDCNAFMIVKTDIEFLAIQILNNENRELGYADYTDVSIYKLRDRLIHDYGIPKKIAHMTDVNISL